VVRGVRPTESTPVGQSQCPVCFTPLEVRDVTPCFICGGWPAFVARFDPASEFTEFRLPTNQLIVLCRSCQLEEFMVPGGWGYRLAPGEKFPVNVLRWVREVAEPRLARDKFCPTCNTRLAFIEVINGTANADPGVS
jgi:hypothetical protein